MNWHDTNPHGANASFTQRVNFRVHTMARSAFASSFARGGGLAPTMFAPSVKEAFLTPWRTKHKIGSDAHIRNLEQMLARDPDSEGLKKAIKKASSGFSKLGMLGRIGGAGLMGAFIALPAFITPGSGAEKARAVVGGLAGWTLGAKAGMGLGAAIGSIVPGVGTAIGAVVGGLAGGIAGAIGFYEGFQALSRIPDRMVDRERARRKLDWVGDKRAFQTQRASTMRQQSMEMMNRGMMSARSMLGREGVMLHQ
jgi:hypothetical protein